MPVALESLRLPETDLAESENELQNVSYQSSTTRYVAKLLTTPGFGELIDRECEYLENAERRKL